MSLPSIVQLREVRADDLRDRREDVDRHRRFAALAVRRDLPRPAGDERHPHAALPHRSLALAQPPGAAGVVAVAQPRAVVAGEDHERVVGELVLVERLQDLAHRPVDLLDHVAEQPLLALPLELVADEQRDVRHRVRDVQEERLRPCSSAMNFTARSVYCVVSFA